MFVRIICYLLMIDYLIRFLHGNVELLRKETNQALIFYGG